MTRKRPSTPVTRHVTVTSKRYGKALKGVRIYYEGKKPKQLKTDGSIQFGKHILELLQKRFGAKFRWIITPNTDAITKERGIWRIRTSDRFLGTMFKELFDRSRDIKNDIVRRFFANTFPSEFPEPAAVAYVPGTLSNLLRDDIVQKLSGEDRDALQGFLPSFLASESVKSVNLLKAVAQIRSLKELADDLNAAIKTSHGEHWWQSFIRGKILIIQQGYIRAVEKMNIAVGNTKFPDFSLVTHDGYLDILEIKKPDTPLLKLDKGRGNYHADTELSRAIVQVENYIDAVTRHADAVRSYLMDTFKLNLKVVRPRGIILAGNAATFADQKEKDDFRLLAHGLKNITVVTYDELATRLENYIKVLEEAATPPRRRRT